MALILIKIALLVGLVILTFGVIPDRRRGAIIAIGTCIAGAVILHFVAPRKIKIGHYRSSRPSVYMLTHVGFAGTSRADITHPDCDVRNVPQAARNHLCDAERYRSVTAG